uniref:Uncharacterized protein n=1 Tax=viral metagenome TaxID=1070528 RepID=A0A6M3LUL4_9ZZZZ
MNVIELIGELEKCPNKDMEVGYEVKTDQLELLIGEDADNPDARGINIPATKWNERIDSNEVDSEIEIV